MDEDGQPRNLAASRRGLGTGRHATARGRGFVGRALTLALAVASCRSFSSDALVQHRGSDSGGPSIGTSGASDRSNAGSETGELGGAGVLNGEGGRRTSGAGQGPRAGSGARSDGQGGAKAQNQSTAGGGAVNAGFGGAGEGGERAGTGEGGHGGASDDCAESGACDGGRGAGGQDVFCDPEVENVNVECVVESLSEYPIPIASGAAVCGVSSTEGFELYVAKRDSDSLGTSWTGYLEDGFRPGTLCFGAIPAPDRLAATTLLDDEPDAFATGRCGTVFERKFLVAKQIWTPWAQASLPTAAASITDVAVSRLPGVTNFMYVTDGRTVFVRHRMDLVPGSAFGSWSKLGGRAGNIVAAATRGDSRQQVFTLDSLGRPLTSVQSSAEVDSPFAAWSDFDSAAVPRLIDIEGIDGLVPLEVFALDTDGKLWWREEDSAGGFVPWVRAPSALDGVVLRSLAGAGLYGVPGHDMTLVGVVENSCAFANERISGVWRGWQAML